MFKKTTTRWKRWRVINSFKILPDDTKNLDYGVYKYDVQIITESNDVFTVIGPSDFVLLGEVNFNVSRSN